VEEKADGQRTLDDGSSTPGLNSRVAAFTPVQWLICGVAALGFAFDLYETLVLPLIARPALAALGNFNPGSRESNLWVGLLFYLPFASQGVFGVLGGYLTDLLGRRRVLVWSILLYAFSACAASFAVTLPQLLFFRCTTNIGVGVEYVAGIAWLAELFSNPKQRESVLGYTQAAFGLGGLMVTAAYYIAVTYAERFPAIHGSHEAWRYTLLSGLIPAVPLILTRPFLPESPIWQEKKSKGTLKRPSFAELFRPVLRRTTLVTTFLVACSYALTSGVILQTPRIVPGLPGLRNLAPRLVEQTVSRVQLFQEIGTFAGRLLFAFLVVRIAAQKRLLRVFLVPGLVVFSFVYFFAATHSLRLLEYGILLAGLFVDAPFSLWGNYLPRMYPTHLRGTGESFVINIGARVIGASGVLLTTQLANIMPGASATARLAYSAGTLAVLAYSLSLIGSFWLREPEHAQLPD
jgi:MFS family permease